MRIVVLGLAITSSWGNGHATTYRALVRALARRGHQVHFFERDAPWYAANRDLPEPPYCTTTVYADRRELEDRHRATIRAADVVIVGSYVPEGIAVGDLVQRVATGVTAFYDIDTPVTLAQLDTGVDYLASRQIPGYDLYLSFTGGPTLDLLRRRYGARLARPLYCSVDPDLYYPEHAEPAFDLGYLGTYSDDRQPSLERLLLDVARENPARRFVVAGPQYPDAIRWPANVERVNHLPPARHRQFYNSLRYTLNITRRDMVAAGCSPSVRLFEAAACGTPIVSDTWPGLEAFFQPGADILVTRSADDTARYLRDLPEADRVTLGRNGRDRVLRAHTAAHRAAELERYIADAGLPLGIAEATPA